MWDICIQEILEQEEEDVIYLLLILQQVQAFLNDRRDSVPMETVEWVLHQMDPDPEMDLEMDRPWYPEIENEIARQGTEHDIVLHMARLVIWEDKVIVQVGAVKVDNYH